MGKGKGFSLQEYIDSSPAKKEAELSRAYEVHSSIIAGAQAAQQGLFQMAQGFRTMRDEKLFKVMGYDTFGDYCEQETGISRQQVYVYIKTVENLPDDLSSQLDKIGISKLSLLTTLSEENREEVISTVDIESATVKELRETIKELTEGKEKAEHEAEELRNRRFEDTEQYASLINSNKALEMLRQNEQDKVEKLRAELDDISKKKDELESQLEELSSAIPSSIDVTQTDEYRELADQKDEEISSLNAELSSVNDMVKEYNDRINKLNKTIAELESRPIDVAVESNDKDKAEIERLTKEISELKDELTSAQDQLERNTNPNYMNFIVKLTLDEWDETIKALDSHKDLFNENFINAMKGARTIKI